MKLTIVRTAGLAAVVAVLAAGGLAAANAGDESVSAPTAVTSTTGTPVLKPGQLRFTRTGWGVSGPNYESGCGAEVPKGWPKVKLADFHAKFTGGKDLWTLRVDCRVQGNKTQAAVINAKIATLKKSVRNFRVLSIVDGTTRGTVPGMASTLFHTKTMTYTYTDGARGTRLVIDRYFAEYGPSHMAFVEIAAAGRPQDLTGLHAAVARATKTFYQAG